MMTMTDALPTDDNARDQWRGIKRCRHCDVMTPTPMRKPGDANFRRSVEHVWCRMTTAPVDDANVV